MAFVPRIYIGTSFSVVSLNTAIACDLAVLQKKKKILFTIHLPTQFNLLVNQL
jgi:hypothetical protein